MPIHASTLAALLVVAAPAAAQESPTANVRTISVSGEAEVKVAPDEVRIRLGVESWDARLAVAREANDAAIRKVIAAARGAGVEEKHVATEQASYEPHFKSDSWKGGRPVLDGYTVRRSMELTLRDVSKFDAVLGAVLEAGANQLHGVEFTTTALRAHRDEARALAIRAAREKAVALAKELGMKPGRARSIVEGSGGLWSGYGYWGGRASYGYTQNVVQSAGRDSEVAGTVAPGQLGVTARVTVVFDLE
jgi:uncharacterized protein YggE